MSDIIKPITLTDDTFQSEVLESSQPVLVDFWAPWCGPCRLIDPIIKGLAADFQGQAKVGKVNVDQHKHFAKQYNVQGIPTLVFFKNGQVVDQVVGVVPKEQLAAKLSALLEQNTVTAEPVA